MVATVRTLPRVNAEEKSSCAGEPFQGLQAKRAFAKACCRKKAPIDKGHGIYNNLPDKNNLNLIPEHRPINQPKAAYRKTRSLQKHIHIQKQSEEGYELRGKPKATSLRPKLV